jgi:hypothetical protein
LLIGFISTLGLAPVTFRRMLIASTLHVGLIAALILIRLGYYRAASLIYLARVWIRSNVVKQFDGRDS